MKQFLLITKIQMKGSLDLKRLFHLGDGRKNAAKLVSGGAVLLLLLFAAMSGMYAHVLCTSLKLFGLAYLVPGLWMAVTSVITLITTIYKVKGTLFAFKDYDLVMSMPVSTATIVASRITVLYLYDLIFTLIIMVPGMLVYGMVMGEGVLFYILGIVLSLFVPMIPILVGTVIGLIVTIASSRFRYSNLISLVLMVILLIGYMVGTTKISSMQESEAMMVDFTKTMSDQIYSLYPFVKMFVLAAVEHQIGAILQFIGITVASFAAFCYVVGLGFKKINTWISSQKASKKYQMKGLKTSSELKSLYQKEIQRYFSSPMYVMNTAVGPILMTLAAVMCVISGEEKVKQMLEFIPSSSQISGFVPLIILLGIGMNCTTAASISLEGKNLWILKSMPIEPKQIFFAKVMVNATISIPCIILNTILFSIRLAMPIENIIFSILLPCCGTLLISLVGLIYNLMFPRFDWKSEMEVVKQGMPTMLALLTGMVIGILPIVVMIKVPTIPIIVLLSGYMIVLMIGVTVSYYYLATKGSRIFQQL